jgi:hypothetical protein
LISSPRQLKLAHYKLGDGVFNIFLLRFRSCLDSYETIPFPDESRLYPFFEQSYSLKVFRDLQAISDLADVIMNREGADAPVHPGAMPGPVITANDRLYDQQARNYREYLTVMELLRAQLKPIVTLTPLNCTKEFRLNVDIPSHRDQLEIFHRRNGNASKNFIHACCDVTWFEGDRVQRQPLQTIRKHSTQQNTLVQGTVSLSFSTVACAASVPTLSLPCTGGNKLFFLLRSEVRVGRISDPSLNHKKILLGAASGIPARCLERSF